LKQRKEKEKSISAIASDRKVEGEIDLELEL